MIMLILKHCMNQDMSLDLVRISKSHLDLIDIYSRFSHFNNLMNDRNFSFEEGLDYITKYMDENGITEEDKLKEHTFRMDSFMLAFQKPF